MRVGQLWRPGVTGPAIRVAKAVGCYLWEANGTKYLDACGSGHVVTVGHGCQFVIDRIKREYRNCSFCGNRATVPDWIPELFDGWPVDEAFGDYVVLFVNSGTEGIEAAIQISHAWHRSNGSEKRHRVLSLDETYHGFSVLAGSISGHLAHRKRLSGLRLAHPMLPAAWSHKQRVNLVRDRFMKALTAHRSQTDPSEILATVVEPAGGTTSGALEIDEICLRALWTYAEESRSLLIADEVVTGCGRTGRYLASTSWDRRPDLIVLSKGLTSGYAVGAAVLCRREIADAIDQMFKGSFFRTTFGGNPITLAAISAVQNYIRLEGLLDRVSDQGTRLRRLLAEATDGIDDVVGIVGLGQLSAIHFRTPTTSPQLHAHELESNPTLAERVAANAARRSILLMTGLSSPTCTENRSHVMITPPFTISDSEIDFLIESLALSVSEECS